MNRIGVIGAGTMGAGIAQVSAQAGLGVVLYDIGPKPLDAGLSRIHASLSYLVERGRLSHAGRDEILGRITTTSSLAEMADVDFVVEAIPEILALKQQVFQELDRVCRPEVVLASNTSSLSVTEIGALTTRPELVVGMHFFNPVPQMKLVEIIRGARTGTEAAAQATALAERMRKVPVQAKDTPGFIVNRIARPFPGEALRLYGENVATTVQIDRVARLAGRFKMGPFELMDLVGMDINFAVNRSVFEQYFQEPRFRPHPLQAQMVKANLLGRKTGEGWYRYDGGRIVEGPAGATFFGNPGPRVASIQSVFVAGDEALANLVAAAGYSLAAEAETADVVIAGDPGQLGELACKAGALLLVEASTQTVTHAAAQTCQPEQVVGYGGIPSVAERQLVEIAPGLRTSPAAQQTAVAFFASLGRDVEVIQDGPGLIIPRIIASLVNEAAYALMEGIATGSDIDTAMKLGVSYPHGPLAWADQLGPDRILAILQGLQQHTGDDRYRPCPYLQHLVAAQYPFHQS